MDSICSRWSVRVTSGTLRDGTAAASTKSAWSCWIKGRGRSTRSLRSPLPLSSGTIRSGIRYVQRTQLLISMVRFGMRFLRSPKDRSGLTWPDCFVFQMTHVFQNYGAGVRFIRFCHGGKDTQFWAGWFGIRVTDSCVEICPAVDT